MITSSPLRYPGGKSSMSSFLAEIRRINGLGGLAFAEPFAGGAGASLTLLYLEETHEIYINDADPCIFAFWWTITNRPIPFMKLLECTPVTVGEWRRQRKIYRENRSSRLRRGFSAFFLNRCNRSGIIMNGGPIGGIDQKGKWRVDARFNKKELLRRCGRVAEYSERISTSNMDGIDLIEDLQSFNVFFFIDPPYVKKGPSLYMNGLSLDYHRSLSVKLKSMQEDAWVLTYDDCPDVWAMYEGWAAIRPFSLRYTAAVNTEGRELLITPKWMRLPQRQRSAAVRW